MASAPARRSRRIRIFETGIERLGRILSRKYEVKVVFKHDECKTTGKVIYLPTLPDNADRELMDAMQGHLDHETSHCVYTDFKAIQKLRRFPKQMTTLNALEDVRIEELWVRTYPGAKVNLKRSAEWALRKIAEEKEMVDPADGQKKKMKAWDGLSDFGKFLHASITYASNNFDETFWFLQQVVEPAILDKVKQHSGHFKAALAADTTGDVSKIAEQLLKDLAEDNPEQQVEDLEDLPEDAEILPPGAGPSPQQQTMQKQGPGGGKKQYQMDPSMSADGSGDQAMPGGSQPGGDGEDGEGGNFNPSDKDLANDDKLLDRSQMLKNAARGENKNLTGEDRYLVFTTETDKNEKIKNGDHQKYKKFMTEAIAMVAPLKRRLSRSLLATAVSRWEGDKTRGKINPRRIYQVTTGTSKRVFRQRVEAESFDTCALLAVDHSGSMHNGQLDLAAKTAIILGELFHQLQDIPFSVYGFSTGEGNDAYQRRGEAKPEEQRLFKRWGSLWVGEYKHFDDPWSRSGHKIINMAHNGKNNTYDGESLRYFAQLLLGRKEKRKILFWLNDGQPCPNGADDGQAHRQYATDCAKEVAKMIELVPIGIGADISHIYPGAVQINDLKDLPKHCIGRIDEILRQGKTMRIGRKAA
jgi:cobalamin biosynthesis protein CobT